MQALKEKEKEERKRFYSLFKAGCGLRVSLQCRVHIRNPEFLKAYIGFDESPKVCVHLMVFVKV